MLVPPELSGVIAIAAGTLHDLGLRADGTGVAWGDPDISATHAPAGLTDVVEIDAEGGIFASRLRDGTVVVDTPDGALQRSPPRGPPGSTSAAGRSSR